jgi:hypothetical protein
MIWDKPRILTELRRLHRDGVDLSYSHLASQQQALLSAAAYHFGSYRGAIEKAGIDYGEVIQRPRWTKQVIIRMLKDAKKKGYELHWSSVTKRGDELARAAFAAIQPRLFGRWDRALHAAGLDADDVVMYRAWDKPSVIFELKLRAQGGEALNSGGLQKDDPGLHAAAIRYFGSYPAALKAAKINPNLHRERRSWDKPALVKALKSADKRGGTSDASLRKSDPGLYGAAIRLFGSFAAARKAAGMGNPKSTNGHPKSEKRNSKQAAKTKK